MKTNLDRKNRKTAFFTLEDFTGTVRVIAFSSIYEEYEELIRIDEMVVVKGKVDRRDEDSEPNIICSEVMPLENARLKFIKKLCVNINTDLINENDVYAMKDLVKKYPGNCTLLLNVKNNGSDILLQSKDFSINPVPQLLSNLRSIVGDDNVWFEG